MSTYLRRGRLAVCVLAASSLILVGCNTSEQDSNSKVSNATSAAAGGSGSASASGEESESSSPTASDSSSEATNSSEKEMDTTKEKESKSTEDSSAKSAKAPDSEKESTSAQESDSAKAAAGNKEADKKDSDKKDSDKDSAHKDHSDKDKSTKDADAAQSGKDKSHDSMEAKGDSHGSKDSQSANGTTTKDSRKDAAAAISLDDAHVKTTGDKSDQTAIFGTLVNNTGKPVIITGFKANVDAAKYEIHHVVDGKMQPKKDSITIPAGGTYTLKPGGDHFMVVGLKKPIKAGDKISITVNVKGGKTIELKDVKVDTTAPDGKKSGK